MYKKQKSCTNSLPSPAHRRGFTLIELIVVMAVIGLLVLFAAPKFLEYTARARETNIKNDVRVLETKIDEYLISHGALPEEWGTGTPGKDNTGEDNTGEDKKCSLLTMENDGPVPISFSDIESYETKYPMITSWFINGGPTDGIVVRFYKTKVNGEQVEYIYLNGTSEDENLNGEISIVERKTFQSLEDIEALATDRESFEPKHPSYFDVKIDGEYPNVVAPDNMSKDLLPRYYANYDTGFNIVNDDCFSYEESVNEDSFNGSPIVKLFKNDDTTTSTNGITGKLYDKTGPIDSMPPGEFKLVESSYYLESKLDGNFYANNDGVVIYEDNNEKPSKGDSSNNEKPIDVAAKFLLTNKNLFALSYNSGEYTKIETDKWNNIHSIEKIDKESIAVYADNGIYLVICIDESEEISITKLENAMGVYNSHNGNPHYIDNKNRLYEINTFASDVNYSVFQATLPAGVEYEDIASIESNGYNIYILSKGGAVYAKGMNDYGQLGNGTIGGQTADFQLISGLNNVVKILAPSDSGEVAVYALDSSGNLYAWGDLNNYGNKAVPSIIKSGVFDYYATEYSVFFIDERRELLQITRGGYSFIKMEDVRLEKLESEYGYGYVVSDDNKWYYFEDIHLDDFDFQGIKFIGVSNYESESDDFGLVETKPGDYIHMPYGKLNEQGVPAEVTGKFIGLLYDGNGKLHYVTEDNVWITFVGFPPS